MSRALTVFNRRERDANEDKKKITKVAEIAGCSDPVARNLMKYAKFGIGPLAGVDGNPSTSSSVGGAQSLVTMERLPARIAAPNETIAGDKKSRMRDLERKLKEEEAARDQEEEAQALEQREKAMKRRKGGKIGMMSLGLVLKREEEVDPFAKTAVEESAPAEPAQPEPPAPPVDEDAPPSAPKRFTERYQPPPPPPAYKPKKDKKRKKTDARDSSSDSDRPPRPGRGNPSVSSGPPPDGGSAARSATSAASAARGSSGGAGLMSEAEIVRKMREGASGDTRKRGSMAAKLRIHKEQQEWESRKADNEEFWKAPKFALCYSAETKRMRGSG